MNHELTFLLTLVSQYGYPIILAIVLCGEFGFPLPITSILVAAGSFTVDGTLNIYLLIILISISAIVGDSIGYVFGRRFGTHIVDTYLHRIGISAQRIYQLDTFLENWGSWSIFLSRWLITPLGVPINILAGFRKFPFIKFLCLITIGEVIWASLCVFIGHLFGANWVMLTDFITNTPLILALIVVGISFLCFSYSVAKKK